MRDLLVRVALGVSLFLPLYVGAVVMGVRSGWLDFRFGFGVLGVAVAPLLTVGSLVLGAAALIAALAIAPRQGGVLGGVAFLIPLLALGLLLKVRAQAVAVPPIHDIATDLQNPPRFSADVAAARAAQAGANGLDLLNERVPKLGRFGAAEGRLITELQQEAYPDIEPIRVPLPGRLAYDLARNAARDMGWRTVRENPEQVWFEGEVRSLWFGFVDDIAVRVTADGAEASVIDVRSCSRVGVSDLGANAKRIRAFRQAMEERLKRAGAR